MTLENMRRGHMLGCADCYNVFGDRLVQELSLLGKIPPRLTIDRQVGEKKMGPLHIGRSPGEKLDFDLSSKLSALNETLKESLKREDYEQAALLRDQINALTQGKVSSPKTAKGDFDE